jgi:hypothetical protein
MRKIQPQIIIVATILLLFAVVVVADDSNLKRDLDRQYEIATNQEPKGSRTSWTISTNDNQIIYHMHNDTSGSNWIVYGERILDLPHNYKDDDSGIIFRVESDGRHVTAINLDGKILWSKDTLADPHLESYRSNSAHIVYIHKADANNGLLRGKKGDFIAISFNKISRAELFGILDVKTGDFTYTIVQY